MTEKEQTNDKKLYSQRSIYIATYLGSPLAAGYLVQQNFNALGKNQYGKYAFIIGIVSTLLLFITIFSIPENIIDKVPNFLIPAFYTLLIALLIEKLQGDNLKKHKDNQGVFYSSWRAAGIGTISLIILSIGIFGYIFLGPQDFDVNKYDGQIAVFNQNEENALELFSIIDTNSSSKAMSYIDNPAIPLWEKNIEILKDLDKLPGLTQDFILQNQILKEYCELRIQSYKLIKVALKENSTRYDNQIESLNLQIEKVLSKLKK